MVEVIISLALFVLLISGILASLTLSAKMHRRSQARLEAFTLASFLADQVRLSTTSVIDIVARGAGNPSNTIPIVLPPNALPFPPLPNLALARNYDLRIMGAAPVSALDINNADINYAQDWMDKNPDNWWTTGSRRNPLAIDQRVFNLGNDSSGTSIAYQQAVPVNDTDRSITKGKTSGMIGANAVVIIQRSSRQTTPDALGRTSTFVDYTIRVDVALDKTSLPDGQPIFASARTYVSGFPQVFASPNVLLSK